MSEPQKIATPDIIAQLVAKFNNDRETYCNAAYNETLTRVDFINPMFKALGWDMDNAQGYADAYRDVIHEDAIKIGGTTKAPDYCFRIGGTRKFFLEAKKPGVDIRNSVDAAYQLRRYAWSAKLPLSILTDFQEFAIYDCRIKPNKDDKASTARVFYCTYDQYLEKWPEIASIFAREAILKGSFDRYADTTKRKRGTAEVDEAFLVEIERFRDLLARNIALRNELSQRDLNFAVQRTIDRIIFLRICEDRGVEVYANLQALIAGPAIYPRLCTLYDRADERYNSGLFHFRSEMERNEEPDELTRRLNIDDKVLKEIIGSLYYPDSPYEFSVLGADILGQVYEQFLGKVITLSKGGRASVEEKPEVRKAGGVYYTPTYIVDYIVANTVGKLVEGKTPKQVTKIRVLDPACGSGSFLIGAYQFLLDWHLNWYTANDPESHAKGRNADIFRSRTGWKLTAATRKRILLNNIYGVDIDNQAVEVTKLSLLLKVLEGETGEALASQLRLFHERALPDLGNNIKCGNSLIGPDFYENEQMLLLDNEEKLRVNVFDWRKEFAPAMKSGGFDAVIGNPPYIRMEEFKLLKDYLRRHYKAHDERSDLYAYFIERGHALLADSRRFGMIVSNKFLRANYGKPLRQLLSSIAAVEQIVDFAGLPVFRGATVRTIVLLSSKCVSRSSKVLLYAPPVDMDSFAALQAGTTDIDELTQAVTRKIPLDHLSQNAWTFDDPATASMWQRIAEFCQTLAEYCEGKICRGVVSGLAEAFVIDQKTRDRIVSRSRRCAEIIKPFLNGRNIRRYYLEPNGDYLIYTYHGVKIRDYPAIETYLRPFKAQLEKRATRQEWYELQQPQMRFSGYMDGPKIVFPDIATGPRFALDTNGYYGANTVYFIPGDDRYLLGLLNSRFALLYFKATCAGLEGKKETYLRFFGQYLESFPIPVLELNKRNEKAKHARMVTLVDHMLKLQSRMQAERAGHGREALGRQIAAVDAQIDKLVYELYGLSEEEIRLVEEATG